MEVVDVKHLQEFFIHQNGTLITHLNNPHVRFMAFQFEKMINVSRWVEVRINEVEVLRKRADAVVPCENSLHDNDQEYRRAVIQTVGCIPAYWKRFVHDEMFNGSVLKPCSKKEQFRNLTRYMPNHFENGTSLYTQPCSQMSISVDTAQADLAFYQEENIMTYLKKQCMISSI